MIANSNCSTGHTDYLSRLQDSLREQQRCFADCLILSHPAPALSERLRIFKAENRVIELSLPQSEWQFGESELSAAVTWAVSETGITDLYLFGHSGGLSFTPIAHSFESNDMGDATDTDEVRVEILSDGDQIREHRVRFHLAKYHFAWNVLQLLSLSAVQSRIRDNELNVFSLFYLEYTDSFLIYDPVNYEFVSLTPEKLQELCATAMSGGDLPRDAG